MECLVIQENNIGSTTCGNEKKESITDGFAGSAVYNAQSLKKADRMFELPAKPSVIAPKAI